MPHSQGMSDRLHDLSLIINKILKCTYLIKKNFDIVLCNSNLSAKEKSSRGRMSR